MRFTKDNRQQILDNNEGFTTKTHFRGKNFHEDRTYTIADGKLKVRATGSTSWADSRYDDKYEYGANDDVTKRYLRENKEDLDTDI